MLVGKKIPKMQVLFENEAAQATGVIVVIDVLHTFTTTAYALGNGAEKIILVSKPEEAKTLQHVLPDTLTIGHNGPANGYNYDLSPWSFAGGDLGRRILIQCSPTAANTVHKCPNNQKVLLGSFVTADATMERIHSLEANEVTFVLCGDESDTENKALADYFIMRLMGDEETSASSYLKQVANSNEGKRLQASNGDYPLSDLDAAMAVDSFHFTMEITHEGGLQVIQPTKRNGTPWRS